MSSEDTPSVDAATAWTSEAGELKREAGEPDSQPVPISDLDRVILALEEVDWSRVPGVTASTAALFASLLQEARADAAGDRGGRP